MRAQDDSGHGFEVGSGRALPLACDPDLDVGFYAAEVATAFDLATRAER